MSDSTPQRQKLVSFASLYKFLHLSSLIHTTTNIYDDVLFTYSSISDLAGNLLKKFAGTEGILLLNRGWRSMNSPTRIAITWNGVT